jgi:predicted GIY-YIG superfamily endonuclease
MEKTNIYVLKCEKGKYYVGKTNNIERRIEEHTMNNGSAWTQKYKPLKIVEVLKNQSPFMEDTITKKYMAKHGIDNVRGGAYVQEKLDDVQYDALQRELWSVSGACMRCGRKTHIASECYAKTTVDGYEIEDEDDDEEEDDDIKPGSCYRCGRKGHYSNNCYAKTDVKGYYLDSDDED